MIYFFKILLKLKIFKNIFVGLLLMLLPTFIAWPILRFMGCKVDFSSRVGFSFIYSSDLFLGSSSRIGHFNLIFVPRFFLHKESIVGSFNWFNGHFSMILRESAVIGSRNVVTRAQVAKEIGVAYLKIGAYSKITSGHKLDLLRSILIGKYSIIAGSGSQLWTHGYIHEPSGERYRVDGKIIIGNNVYIGSACVFNPGVEVVDNVSIGSQCCISKDLLLSGFYVNQPLRYIGVVSRKTSKSLVQVEKLGLSEKVLLKKRSES